MEWFTVMLLNPPDLGTQKAMKGRKSGLSGEMGDLMDVSC